MLQLEPGTRCVAVGIAVQAGEQPDQGARDAAGQADALVAAALQIDV
ncbi:hypothetical protein [Streptomyces sp. NPDC004721]